MLQSVKFLKHLSVTHLFYIAYRNNYYVNINMVQKRPYVSLLRQLITKILQTMIIFVEITTYKPFGYRDNFFFLS